MKKRLFLVAVLAVIAFSGKAQANTFDTEHTDMWRSSYTCGRVNFALISTGTIFAHGLIISSPTVNIGPSFFTLYNGTSPSIMTGSVGNMNITTATSIQTNATAPTPMAAFVPFDIPLSSGAIVNAEGAACRTFLWDFFPSKFPYYWVPFRP